MIAGVQMLGIFFALVMMFLTYYYYKKEHYSLRGWAVWSAVWLAFIVLVSFPSTVYGVMETLDIERTVDFFVICGFFAFAVILFYVYMVTKRTQRRVEELVRRIAMRERK